MAEKIGTLLDLIDNGSIVLPEFQRGYVWNRDQVRAFVRSLYRRYPVGSLLIWRAKSDAARLRGNDGVPPGYLDLLLDGQQRLTTLYGLIRGRPPRFFEGNAQAFTGLQFHLDDEVFEFYGPVKMGSDPRWIDVTTLLRDGLAPFIGRISTSHLAPKLDVYVDRLARLQQIKEIELYIERITGEDKTLDVVVEIFDRVNSGGTKLSKADLALAKLCAEWPETRDEMRAAIGKWSNAGFHFRLEWLLRVVNAVVTGEAKFEALARVSAADFASGLKQSQKAIDILLNNISAHLGLDHDRVLAGRYAFAVMARHLVKRGGQFADAGELNKLLYWYVHSFLLARYTAGPTETVLNQDLDAVDRGGVDGLLTLLRTSRGELAVRPEELIGYGIGARFYPLLYLLTRVYGARDWWNGAPQLSAHMLGKLARLQVHHIFPKAVLYANGYSRAEVNALANFCFLTTETNLWVGARAPEEYFEMVEAHYPGALASQWIPMDRSLWKVSRYLDFLAARRMLLANAANAFLESLLQGTEAPRATSAPEAVGPASVELEADADRQKIDEIAAWAVDQGLSEPEQDVEIVDPETGSSLAVAELAWLGGLQEGLGEPVVLDLEMTDEVEERLAAIGYHTFSDPARLEAFIRRYLDAMSDASTAA